MRNQILRPGRAMVLGLFVLAVSAAVAQSKTAIERMNDRVAEWQKAPTERFIGFEVAFPTTQEEVDPPRREGLLLVTIITKDSKKDYVSNVAAVVGDTKLQLTSLGTARAIYSADPSMTREDYVYYLPIASANGDFECVVTVGWPPNATDLGRLPAWPSDAVRAFTKKPRDGEAQLSPAELLKKEFPDLPLQPPRVRISSGVAQSSLLTQVKPTYPASALKNHITGTVVLAATIGIDGHIQNLKAISGPPILIQAATDAVSQWQYRPYQLNGTPTVVETTITVNFQTNR